MRRVYGHSSERPNVDSMMTPMIDVVFLLLIFFLTTSSFQKLEKQLPSAAATPPDLSAVGSNSEEPPPPTMSDFNDVVIKISTSKAGGVTYKLQNQDISSIEQLIDRVEALIKVRNDVPIIIDPDREVQAGEALRVYDLVRRRGSLAVFLVAK